MSDKFTWNNDLKRQPFAVPKEYFESFVVKKTTLNDAWNENPFAVPENYFDTIQERIIERITTATIVQPVSTWQAIRTQFAFAASFIVLAGMGYGLFSLLRSDMPPAALPGDNYVEVIPTYVSGMFDEQTLLRAATYEETSTTNAVGDDAIIHYLANANLSMNDIAALY